MLERIMGIQPLRNKKNSSKNWKQSKSKSSDGDSSFKEILSSLMSKDNNLELEGNNTLSSTKATTVAGYHVDLKI